MTTAATETTGKTRGNGSAPVGKGKAAKPEKEQQAAPPQPEPARKPTHKVAHTVDLPSSTITFTVDGETVIFGGADYIKGLSYDFKIQAMFDAFARRLRAVAKDGGAERLREQIDLFTKGQWTIRGAGSGNVPDAVQALARVKSWTIEEAWAVWKNCSKEKKAQIRGNIEIRKMLNAIEEERLAEEAAAREGSDSSDVLSNL